MKKRARFQPLPFSAKEEIARAVENLNERTTTTGVRRQLLSVGKRKEDNSSLRTLQDGAADDARGGDLCSIEQFECSGFVGGEQGALRHAPNLPDAVPACLDAGQRWARFLEGCSREL